MRSSLGAGCAFAVSLLGCSLDRLPQLYSAEEDGAASVTAFTGGTTASGGITGSAGTPPGATGGSASDTGGSIGPSTGGATSVTGGATSVTGGATSVTGGGIGPSTGGATSVTGGVSSVTGGATSAPGGVTSACDIRGSWAMRARVDAAWGGRDGGLAMLADDGRGTIEVLTRLDIEEVGEGRTMIGVARVCGVRLPPLYATVAGFMCESHQPVFDPRIWESPDMPTPEVRGEVDCPTLDECHVNFGAALGQFGIELDDPTSFPAAEDTAKVPCARGKGPDCFPDHDGDGRPGVSVTVVTEGASPTSNDYCSRYVMRGAPLSDNPSAIFDGVRRTDRLDLGISAELQPELTFKTCDRASGGGRASGFDSRAISCLIEPGTFEFRGPGASVPPAGPMDSCTEKERLFMDENLPVYDILNQGDVPAANLELRDQTPSVGPRFEVVRLSEPVEGCASVLEVFATKP